MTISLQIHNCTHYDEHLRFWPKWFPTIASQRANLWIIIKAECKHASTHTCDSPSVGSKSAAQMRHQHEHAMYIKNCKSYNEILINVLNVFKISAAYAFKSAHNITNYCDSGQSDIPLCKLTNFINDQTQKVKRAIHKLLVPTWPPNAPPTWPHHRNATLHLVYRNVGMLVDLASQIGIGHCALTKLIKNHAQPRARAIHRLVGLNWPPKCTTNTTIL